MKTVLFVLSLTFLNLSMAAPQYIDPVVYCNGGQYSVGFAGGIFCWDDIPTPGDSTNCPTCGGWDYGQHRPPVYPYQYTPYFPMYNQYPNQMYNPWYGRQAPFYYPNYNYPGVWHQGNQGINPHYYPGGGGGVAAKPNVYIQNANAGTEINFKFDDAQVKEMLVTTPALDSENRWKTTLTKDNKFLVNNTKYEYMFYDLRYDHTKLQYKFGFCSDRQTIIDYMLKDIEQLNFPEVSQKDFSEHWNQKIPQIKYYCLYPQYNKQLDQAYPIHIEPQIPIVRTLYLVIPHSEKPKVKVGQFPPLPVAHPEKTPGRTPSSAKGMVLKEWGVSFLMGDVIKN